MRNTITTPPLTCDSVNIAKQTFFKIFVIGFNNGFIKEIAAKLRSEIVNSIQLSPLRSKSYRNIRVKMLTNSTM